MVSKNNSLLKILLADDDQEDILFIKEAFSSSDLNVEFDEVEDGQALMDRLLIPFKEGSREVVLPNLILLDLNMPRKSGQEALKEIKADPRLQKIPVIILTTSRRKKDVEIAYGAGANCYVTKPQTYKQWADTIEVLGNFWFRYVTLPGEFSEG